MKEIYTFSQADASVLNFQVIFNFIALWTIGGGFIYVYFLHQQIIALLFAAFWLFYPPSYRYLYYRWLLFKYNKNVTFSINLSQGVYVYQRGNQIISFYSKDIEHWWRYECGPIAHTFVEIIEIRLKTGDKIILSNELGKVVHFIYDNNNLDFPKESFLSTYTRSKSFHAFIEEIANS